MRYEFTVQGELIIKRHQLLVSAPLRKQLTEITLGSHIAIEECNH
jgi:hypothetical protein